MSQTKEMIKQSETDALVARTTDHINQMLKSKLPDHQTLNEIQGTYIPLVLFQKEAEEALKHKFEGLDFERLKICLDEYGVTKELSLIALEMISDAMQDFTTGKNLRGLES
jgi:hypothetical protein